MKSNKDIASEITTDPEVAKKIQEALDAAEQRGIALDMMFSDKAKPEACGPNCVVAKHMFYSSNKKEVNAEPCHCLDGLSEFNTRKIKHALKYYQRELNSTQNSLSDYQWRDDK
jgi:hypothetical protein